MPGGVGNGKAGSGPTDSQFGWERRLRRNSCYGKATGLDHFHRSPHVDDQRLPKADAQAASRGHGGTRLWECEMYSLRKFG